MEPKFQSSFIPKGPLATTGTIPGAKPRRSLVGFFAKGVFVIALVLAAGVFGYKLYLQSSIDKMGTDLEAAKATLDPATITQISNLNSRIVSTQLLLQNHVVLSPFFDFLQASTLKTVRFTDFAYTSDDKGLLLTMHGQAKGYAAVAAQSDLFSASKYMKNPVFSNLDLDNLGNVTFAFSTNLDPSIVSYKASILNGQVIIPTMATSTNSTNVSASTTAVATSTPKIATTTPKVATSSPTKR